MKQLRGGATKASSWTDAVANAKSFINVITKNTTDNKDYYFSFLVPKEEISSTEKLYLCGTGFNSPVNDWYVAFKFTNTSATTSAYHNSSATGITTTMTYYYI